MRRRSFKRTCRRLVLTCCVFDTVAAVGWLHFATSWLTKKLLFVADNYDMHFVPDVPFGRHAVAIDEYRRDFERVSIGVQCRPNDTIAAIRASQRPLVMNWIEVADVHSGAREFRPMAVDLASRVGRL
jgi:hypothetical protein